MRELERLSELIHAKNKIGGEIADIIGRPSLVGHVGEYIASKIFNIQLEMTATAKGIDGYFTDGVIANRTVNIKWYGKKENVLDIDSKYPTDYYLVMTGPKSSAMTSKGEKRQVF